MVRIASNVTQVDRIVTLILLVFRTFGLRELQAKLGDKQGFWLYNAIRGKDVGEGTIGLIRKLICSDTRVQ